MLSLHVPLPKVLHIALTFLCFQRPAFAYEAPGSAQSLYEVRDGATLAEMTRGAIKGEGRYWEVREGPLSQG